jgi:hypothetical protein
MLQRKTRMSRSEKLEIVHGGELGGLAEMEAESS